MKTLLGCCAILLLTACPGKAKEPPVATPPDTAVTVTPDSARHGADSLGRPLPPPLP